MLNVWIPMNLIFSFFLLIFTPTSVNIVLNNKTKYFRLRLTYEVS